MESITQEAMGYRKLKAWQSADELASDVFCSVNAAPKIPSWLAQQMLRSAVSVPANIVEGYCRGGLKEYIRFLDIARGSLGELEYYIHFIAKLRLLDEECCRLLSSTAGETGRLLFGLVRALTKKEKQGDWDRSRGIREEGTDYLADATDESEELLSGIKPTSLTPISNS